MANEFVIKNGFISKGDSIVNGTISGDTLNLTTTPSNDNSQTQVLVRNNTSGLIEYRDASSLSGTSGTNTFVTGTTFGSNQSITRRNDGADVLILTGGTNVTLSNPSTNQIKFDVNIPSGMNTFVTGFTYNDNNTFTIFDNDGGSFPATINQVSALTVTNYIDYTTGIKPSAISGRTYFDVDENALSYFPQTPANDVTINIGQESVIRVHNNTGVQINNGEVCHITSEQPSVNGVPSVILAIATGDTTTGGKYGISGVATHDIPDGTEGFITSFGLVRDLNITGVTEGTEIYLSDSTPGAFRYTPPDTEFRRSIVGYVVTTGTTTGKILVGITNEVGFSELSESLLSVVTENNASTGTRDGGEVTINSGDNTLFDISSGSGIIVDNYTDPNSPTIQNIAWDSITGNSVTNLTGDSASYIFLDSNTNTVQFGISTPPTEADYRDNIFLGIVGHANFTNLINLFNTPIQIVSPINQHQDLTSAIGPFSINGNRVSNITGTLELQKSVGKSYFYGGNFHTDTKVPSSITTAQLSGSTLIYAKGTTVLGPSGTTIDPDNYDPDGAGTITPIPGVGAYVAHRIWHQPSSNLLIFQYGQEFYVNAAIARDEFEFENFVVPAGLNETSYLVAIIIAQDGDTDLDSATIIPQGKFAGTGGGGGSAADTLQTAYDNSSSPEIITDSTRGAVDFRVGSGSDSDNVVTFQQNSGTINAFVEGTGDAKFTNLTGTSVTSNSAINVFNGHINIRDNSFFLQGRTVADANVSLIGVDNQDRVFVGNAGYDTYIDSDTIVDGVLSAQTAFLTSTPTLNNSATDILVRNSSTGEVEYRPVSGITPDTNTYVTGGTVSVPATDSSNSGSIGLFYKNFDGTPRILPFEDTFTTGSTYDNGTALATFDRNDGTSYTLDLSTIDVNDTFSTGFTYNNANTLTISRNDGVDLSTSINTMTGLTVNGTLVVDTFSATTYTGLTLNDLDDVTTNIPPTPDNSYQGELIYFDVASNQWVSGEEYGNLGDVTIWGKKGSAGTIDKGCPVYIVGFDDDIHEVELANATTATTMPVIGFTAEDFDNAGVYPIVTFGKITGLDTSSATTVVNPFGETWEVNDVLYMSKSDGGLTKFRPSGTDTQIQRIAKVLKVGTTDGQLFIFNTARTAGLPNLTTDYLWVGNGDDTPQELIRTDVGITVTGFTYDNINTFTINDNVGSAFTTSINVLSATTYYGDGSNLTGVGGGPSLREVTGTTTFATANETVNCTSGTFVVNLPTAVGIQGTTYTLVNSGTGIITMKGSLGQTINGSATIGLKRQYISRTVQSNGLNWIVI